MDDRHGTGVRSTRPILARTLEMTFLCHAIIDWQVSWQEGCHAIKIAPNLSRSKMHYTLVVPTYQKKKCKTENNERSTTGKELGGTPISFTRILGDIYQ